MPNLLNGLGLWFSESGDDCEKELRKFAELIVKECVRVCEDDLLDEYMRKCFAAQEEGILYAAVADCCSAMKQHFGVE